MILLHLFCSAVPRELDTPRMRAFARTACMVLLAIVIASAVSRGDDSPAATAPGGDASEVVAVQPESVPTAAEPVAGEASAGRGHVSIIHVSATPDVLPAGPAAGSAPERSEAPEVAVPVHPEASAPAHASSPAAEADLGAAVALPSSGTDLVMPAHDEPAIDAAHSGAQSGAAEPHADIAHQPHSPDAAVLAPQHATGAPALYAPRDQVEDFAESGRRFWLAGDHVAAEKAFTRALTANVGVERKRALVLEMAGLYEGAGQLPKAVAVLEKFIKTYPSDREIPQVLLRLGVVYRDLGVYAMATSRFFQVLNSTLRVSDEDLPEYRKLAMKARLEIAETYAAQGNLSEAEKYFARLQLLDLDAEDRERVLLRSAQMQFTLRQWLGAEKALATFVSSHPDSLHLAEVRYMRAKALEELGRKQEAVDEVVALLQMPPSGDTEAARSAAYWKRRCANELANRFYEQGDFLGALAIYQALARASMDPTWRWPAIYQIGLCFERMEMPQRAAEAYEAILAPDTAPAAGTKLPDSLASLQDMARWRRSHLTWIDGTARQLEALAPEKPAG